MTLKKSPDFTASYQLDDKGCFVIENYNHSKQFSNFFPGIAGLWGIPMWVFYVNRGQAISSFGIESKDKAILEFQPANKAYRQTSLQGFRTFIKVKSGAKVMMWEPFQNTAYASAFHTRQTMSVTSHDLTIEDINLTLGLKISVNYFTIPEENFPALVRKVTLENLTRKAQALEMVDGLPVFIPYGMNEWTLKNMSRTVEAWVRVGQAQPNAPYFHLNVEVADRPDVKHIEEGNFYFSLPEGGKNLSDMIVEAQAVFGNSGDFRSPERFLFADKFVKPSQQQTSNRMPCAMSFNRFKINPGQRQTFFSLIGHAHSKGQLKDIIRKAQAKDFFNDRSQRNKDITTGIKNFAFTHSASYEFDLYSGQTFLDNVLRGGLPVSLKTRAGMVTFNVYSRKHGDLERDYNYFVLAPTPYSQGNGNYRDVNQNRRNDVWFNPEVGESSIVDFMNLLQADGHNPLVVKGLVFSLNDHSQIDGIMERCVSGDNAAKLKERLQSSFQPGELLNFIIRNDIRLKVSVQGFLGMVLNHSHKITLADHGEGFWIDHWTYNLDLIESFLGIYPDRLKDLLLLNNEFHFYLNSHYIVPRIDRYLLTTSGVRQYHSVKDANREVRAEHRGHKLRTRNGEGEIYKTTLVVKLLCLIANKAATFDPSGMGIEMEADKPSWYDALNGLPGLLGSSVCETLELKRYARFLLKSLNDLRLEDKFLVSIFEELADFIASLKKILKTKDDSLVYWQDANEAKELYRRRVLCGVSGEERSVSVGEVREFLDLVIARTNEAVERAKDSRGLVATYFYHDVTEYDVLQTHSGEFPHVFPTQFKAHRLPLFLEGLVHYFRCLSDPGETRALFQKVRKSELFDPKLKMYKVNADLETESENIGRTRIFPPGWLENESIWLHMEYKYLLELLRQGLSKEFFETFREVLVPFLPPQQYGRSTLENSSFIVSSAHEDKNLHGQGFVARLSGSTAEFLHIWLWMNAGQQPFSLDGNNKLILKFEPTLPGWLFTKKVKKFQCLCPDQKWHEIELPANTYAFIFLGQTLVVYHNPTRKDLQKKVNIRKIVLTYPSQKMVELTGPAITMPCSQDVRDRKVRRIDIYLN